jgi:DNA-binding HxlR family transcriptional regulator
MATRGYGQYCGLSRAAELVGERWALLIIRDLLVGERRFTDLLRSLPGIPTNVLTERLKELEAAGVVRRRVLDRPARGIAYELTPYGRELEDAVIRLGCWGAKTLGDPRPGETVTPESLVMALRSTFQRDAARGVHVAYEVRFGEIVLHARIDDGTIAANVGPLPSADLVIEAGPALKAIMARELSPRDAVAGGGVKLTGDPKLLDLFAELFRIAPLPAAQSA